MTFLVPNSSRVGHFFSNHSEQKSENLHESLATPDQFWTIWSIPPAVPCDRRRFHRTLFGRLTVHNWSNHAMIMINNVTAVEFELRQNIIMPKELYLTYWQQFNYWRLVKPINHKIWKSKNTYFICQPTFQNYLNASPHPKLYNVIISQILISQGTIGPDLTWCHGKYVSSPFQATAAAAEQPLIKLSNGTTMPQVGLGTWQVS